ncbi:MAG: ketopantoate reductase family protein [Halarcobacter sp.]
MNFIILGAGGIGSFYGAKLIEHGHHVLFVARGEHLKALQQNGLKLQHPKFKFNKKVDVTQLSFLNSEMLLKVNAVIITTKSTSTEYIAKELSSYLASKQESFPFIISLQNGVENEDILCKYFPKDKVIGGLCRKIGAHIVKPGVIEATGDIETIIGAMKLTNKSKAFLLDFKNILTDANIFCGITDNIKFELWKKLIINNGVNAICALLRIKTGKLMSHNKLSKIVLELMKETATAARVQGVKFTNEDVIQMYELIKNFDSIKPSMLVDVENNRPIELDEICTIVIKNCESLKLDAPYTRTISTLLSYTYIEKRGFKN